MQYAVITIYFLSAMFNWKMCKVYKANNIATLGHILDLIKILNFGLGDQTTFYRNIKWRQLPIEEDLKILKGDLTHISN